MKGKEVKGSGFYKWDAYDCVTDVGLYCKRKRKARSVILDDCLLPLVCAYCGKTIKKGEPNRTDLDPRTRTISPMHYECSWKALFEEIYSYRIEDGRLVKI